MENEAKTVCSVCGVTLPDRGEWKPAYLAIGESDKRIAELEAEVASLRARLAEVDSWKSGEVPEGVDRIEVVYKTRPPIVVKLDNHHYHTDGGLYVNPSEECYLWRPLKEEEQRADDLSELVDKVKPTYDD